MLAGTFEYYNGLMKITLAVILLCSVDEQDGHAKEGDFDMGKWNLRIT